MRTDDLINGLAAEVLPLRGSVLTRTLSASLMTGLGLASLFFALFWGPRTGLAAALSDPVTASKTALPLALGLIAFPVCLARARPGGQSRATSLLWVLPVIVAALVSWTYLQTPPSLRHAFFVGTSIWICLSSIPLLSSPILLGLLLGLRRGAPERPALCGAVAGLVAAGFGATIYSLFCIEDSPLFFGTWYALAIAIVAAAGAAVGSRILRW